MIFVEWYSKANFHRRPSLFVTINVQPNGEPSGSSSIMRALAGDVTSQPSGSAISIKSKVSE
ncbi:hypothetical protein BLX87_12600 [Bacillus sp. VT-16-64]|nr:hypothetical protein BLX87_12600 [Bacillus sp. VT-16-64]